MSFLRAFHGTQVMAQQQQQEQEQEQQQQQLHQLVKQTGIAASTPSNPKLLVATCAPGPMHS